MMKSNRIDPSDKEKSFLNQFYFDKKKTIVSK